MIMIAIIRISKVHTSDFTIWATFWQQIEACIAVLMLSLTAFRALYVAAKTSPGQQKNKTSYSSRKRLWSSSKKLQDERYIELSVPRTTLTGMHTVIAGNQSISWPIEHGDHNDFDKHSDVVSLAVHFSIERTD